jgi:hypothetical protein
MTLNSVITNPNSSSTNLAHRVRHAAIRDGTVTHILKQRVTHVPKSDAGQDPPGKIHLGEDFQYVFKPHPAGCGPDHGRTANAP